MQTYQELLSKCLGVGIIKDSRAGKTYSMSNVQIFFENLEAQFPLLTTKRMNWKGILAEFFWILSGSCNIKDMQETTGIWDSFADKNGNVDSAYGELLQVPVDQFKYVINLLTNNPFSRRAVMTSWRPNNAVTSNLPPCHLTYIFNVHPARLGDNRNILNLNVTMRSADLALGLPWDIAIWGLMLKYFATILGMKSGTLCFNIVDAHIYHNQVNGILTWLRREPKQMPKVTILNIENLDSQTCESDFILENYDPHSAIKFPLSVGDLS